MKRDTIDDTTMARMNQLAIIRPSGFSIMLAAVVYRNTAVINANGTTLKLRARQQSKSVAMQALDINTSTPVAYAAPCASTDALNHQVTKRLTNVKSTTSGLSARDHSGAMP